MPFTDVPPSYDSSVSREAWTIVAPYISSPDLCACCLVSRKWHGIFIPFLWGDPASHFGIANDAVYIALTRFKRTLRRVRPSVRGLTHTLHLPPALSEIYGGPHATWLRDVLEYLPNLQSLIVNKLPFFDHHSLVALRATSTARRLSTEERPELPTFGLKLLLASGEPNTTWQGLHIAIPRFPALVYLDLSYTKTARDPNVLATFANLHDLQVLKLRAIGLRDGEAEVLANAIGIRVRLLDLRDNLLTDMAVRSLMQACFLPPDRDPDASRLNTRRVEDWPIGMAPGPDFFSLDTLRGEELDRELLKQLTNPLTGRLAFEDIPHRGLTHLFIANNKLSVEGLSSLLKSERLHILDGGSVDVVKTIARTKSLTSSTGYVDEVKFPGAEKLIPVLAKSASKNLTYLRVDHAIVTAKIDAPKEKDIPKDDVPDPKSTSAAPELPGTVPLAELPSTSRTVVELSAPANYAVEMPASRDAIFEMDATPMQPRAELPGDIIHFALSPPVGDKPKEETPIAEIKSPIRGEGPYAPEVVVNGNGHTNGEDADTEDDHHTHDSNKVSDDSSTNSTTRSLKSPVSPISPAVQNAFQPLVVPVTTAPKLAKPQPKHPPSPPPPPPPPPPQRTPPTLPPRPRALHSQPSTTARQLRIDFLLSKRPASLSSQPASIKLAPTSLTELYPAVLPNLRTLILTDVPTSVPLSSPLIPALKSFISSCAIESALSHLLAATDYSLPPGRARHLAEQAAAKRLFALRTIVLEMEPPSALSKSGAVSGQRAWEHSRQRLSMSKSSTGDRDSENLWTAAADDFSFFAEGGGEELDECGIYQHEQDKYFPTANLDEKMLVGSDDSFMYDMPNGAGGGGGLGGGNSPHGSFKALSPIHALGWSGTNYNASPLRSPRELPLGRNRRSSNETPRNSFDGAPGMPRSERNVTMESMASGALLLNAPRNTAQMLPTSNPDGSASVGRPTSPSGKSDPGSPDEPTLDVVAELASWRKQRKAAFETAMAQFARFKPDVNQGTGEGDDGVLGEILPPFVEGYWKGEVKVVRNAAPKGRSGIVDVFGNYFEKGYLYP